jgi:hypothetical protein
MDIGKSVVKGMRSSVLISVFKLVNVPVTDSVRYSKRNQVKNALWNLISNSTNI